MSPSFWARVPKYGKKNMILYLDLLVLKIEEGKINILAKDGSGQKDISKKVPYKAMLTDFVVWGIVLSMTFIRIGYWIFVQFGPIYLNKVSHF
jgi:hypothetical protein